MGKQAKKTQWWAAPLLLFFGGSMLYAAIAVAYALADGAVTDYQLSRGSAQAEGVIASRSTGRRNRDTVVYTFSAPDGAGRIRSYSARQYVGPARISQLPVNTPVRIAYVADNPRRSAIAGVTRWPGLGRFLGGLLSIVFAGGLGGAFVWAGVATIRDWRRKDDPPAAPATPAKAKRKR